MQSSTTAGRAAGGAPAPTQLRSPSDRFLTGGWIYLWLLLAALAVSALSLTFPSTPSYDPWSWLLWGRQIIHGTLDLTHNGSSWKPLPMLFTTPLALFGGAAPYLWLLVARAGFILSLLLAFKLAWRLTRALVESMPGATDEPVSGWLGRLAIIAPPLLAGLITIVGTGLTHTFPGDSLLGYSEGVAVAGMLIAAERAIDGHHRQAFVLGIIPCLDRPEAWVFWGLYGLWLMWKDPGSRALVVGLGILMVALWFVPGVLGGRNPGSTALANHAKNSAVNSSFPFWRELYAVEWTLVLTRVKLVGILAIIASAWILWRRRNRSTSLLRWRPADRYERTLLAFLTLGVFGFAWWLIIAIETQAGFPGNPRYAVFGSIPEYICGAVGYSWVAVAASRWAGRWLAGRGHRISWDLRTVAATAVLALVFVFGPNYVGSSLMKLSSIRYEQRYQARIREQVAGYIRSHGGRTGILRCGSIVTENHQVTMLAWYLDVRTRRIDAGSLASPDRPVNLVVQVAPGPGGQLGPADDIIGAWIAKGLHYRMTFTDPVNFYEDCRK